MIMISSTEMKRTVPSTIDDYIADHPPAVQKILKAIRRTIRKAAPDAEEAIKYQIPAYVLNGNLVYFAAFTNHVSVYPAPRGAAAFKEELAQYKGGKGTVQFPLDKPIPHDLIRRIVEYRVAEQSKKKKPSRSARSQSPARSKAARSPRR
jgi:uncharacterized protein YdhG (YjbR/CyaY superfamily)